MQSLSSSITRRDIRHLVIGAVLVIAFWLPAVVIKFTSVAAFDFNAASFKTSTDTIPNFAKDPTITSAQSGSWSDVATWQQGRVPTSSDIIQIAPNTVVTIDTTNAVAGSIGVDDNATLAFAPDVDTKLKVTNILVNDAGTVTAGSNTHPVSARAEIEIADTPLNPETDPRQFGTGIIGFGTFHFYGKTLENTYIQLSQEIAAGSTAVHLSQPASDWKVGDEILLPDTRQITQLDAPHQYAPQLERVHITAISPDNLTLTVDRAFTYSHGGARDGDNVIQAYPHAGNLSRTILIHSENTFGTRGHVLFTRYADVDIRYTHFKDLGRTTSEIIDSTTFNTDGSVAHYGSNQIGRYMLHMHHVFGPQAGRGPGIANTQFNLEGNSFDSAGKWALAIHNSSYGVITKNVVTNLTPEAGAGISFEDGTERGNEVSFNFVAGVNGAGRAVEGLTRVAGENSGSPLARDLGFEGSCYWMHQNQNNLHDNVAANCYNSGFNSTEITSNPESDSSALLLPAYAGANKALPGQGEVFTYNKDSQDQLFKNSTVYGATGTGVELWFRSEHNERDDTADNIRLRNLFAWNISNIYVEDHNKFTVTEVADSTFLGDPTQVSTTQSKGTTSKYFVYKNIHAENLGIGIPVDDQSFSQNSAVEWVDGAYLRNRVNLAFTSTHDSYRSSNSRTTLNTITFRAPVGLPLVAVKMSTGDTIPAYRQEDHRTLYLTKSTADGVAIPDSELFFGMQSANATYPSSEVFTNGPIAEWAKPGIYDQPNTTNGQLFGLLRRSVYSKLASCENESNYIVPAAPSGAVNHYVYYENPYLAKAYICPIIPQELKGRVVDAAGNPIEGATASLNTFLANSNNINSTYAQEIFNGIRGPEHHGDLYSFSPAERFVSTTSAVSGADGTYTLPYRAPAGQRASLTVLADGYAANYAEIISLQPTQPVVETTLLPGSGDGLKAGYFLTLDRGGYGYNTDTDSAVYKDFDVNRVEPNVNKDFTQDKVGGVVPKTSVWYGELLIPSTDSYHFNLGQASSNFGAVLMKDGERVDILTTGRYSNVELEGGRRYQLIINYVRPDSVDNRTSNPTLDHIVNISCCLSRNSFSTNSSAGSTASNSLSFS